MGRGRTITGIHIERPEESLGIKLDVNNKHSFHFVLSAQSFSNGISIFL